MAAENFDFFTKVMSQLFLDCSSKLINKKKKSMGDTDNCVAPPPGNSDGFVGPRSADAALPTS